MVREHVDVIRIILEFCVSVSLDVSVFPLTFFYSVFYGFGSENMTR